MAEMIKKTCPACQGTTIIKGECVCDMEWRGTQKDDDWDDCQCTPDQMCKTCFGKGFVEEDE